MKCRKWQMEPLTSLVSGNVDWGILRGVGALVWHSIDSLNLKCVLRVGQQVANVDPRFCQAQLTGQKLHVVATAGAATPTSAAALTDDVENHVLTSPRVPWRQPLQHHWGFVHTGDNGLWRWRDSWKHKQGSLHFIKKIVVRCFCGLSSVYWPTSTDASLATLVCAYPLDSALICTLHPRHRRLPVSSVNHTLEPLGPPVLDFIWFVVSV